MASVLEATTPPLLSDIFELTKPRICLLALIMTALGYGMAPIDVVPEVPLWSALVGIALIGASCGALNMVFEKDLDARMVRTQSRPLPTGRISVRTASLLGAASGVLGFAWCIFWVNPLTAGLGALTWLSYLGLYTPAKRISSLSTLIGALPGALPPLMGYTAATGEIGPGGLLLFAILFLWQVPHFLAIAWIYRDDYARALLPILTVLDPSGAVTSRQIVLYSVSLLPVSLLPSLLGITGFAYFMGALLLGLGFIGMGLVLAFRRTRKDAYRLFLVSILYLPLIGLLMIFDKI